MNEYHLDEMKKGWFIGNFKPSSYNTDCVEVAIQHFNAGDYKKNHLHKIATEITVIVLGKVKINTKIYTAGCIVEIMPGEIMDFKALENTTTVVVKIPCALNDKYILEC